MIAGIGQRAFAWLRFLKIERLEPDRVTLRAIPGHREVLNFCNEQRLAQIARHLEPILGRRVRVVIENADAATNAPDESSASSASPAPAPSSRSAQRREAMNLPLVQRVLETFPDATILDARDESETPPAPPSSPEGTDP